MNTENFKKELNSDLKAAGFKNLAISVSLDITTKQIIINFKQQLTGTSDVVTFLAKRYKYGMKFMDNMTLLINSMSHGCKTTKKFDDLFYSLKEKKMFYVAGYVDNSDKITETLKVLKEGETNIKKLIGSDKCEISSRYIERSSRYKSMRVFYVDTRIIPPNAFALNNDWDMWKWLTN